MESNKKIIIFSTSRSGSTYLTNLISYHANLKAIHEPFQEEMIFVNSTRKLDNIIKRVEKFSSVLKTHINQFNNLPQDYKNFFLGDSWYKISLLRKNLHNSILSHIVANKLDNFGDKKYSKVSLIIDKEEYLKTFSFKMSNIYEISLLKKLNLLDKLVYFEDLTFNNKVDIQNLNFPFNVFEKNKKLLSTKTPLEKIKIINYDELLDLYNKTLSNIDDDTYLIIKNGTICLK